MVEMATVFHKKKCLGLTGVDPRPLAGRLTSARGTPQRKFGILPDPTKTEMHLKCVSRALGDADVKKNRNAGTWLSIHSIRHRQSLQSQDNLA